MRAALYARVSTASQSVAAQLDELGAVARQRRWRVVLVAHDVGSGARSDLPERARVLELARSGGVDVVAVWRLDRLGRSVRDLLDAAETLRRAHVELVSLREAIDTGTPTGRLVFTIIASVAELEREIIAERVRSGLDRAKREGKKLGRPRVDVDVELVHQEMNKHPGWTVGETARALGYSERTLRRALERALEPAAKTPRSSGSKNGRKPGRPSARARPGKK